MGSHSVTCHPAELTFPPLPQPKLVLDSATPEGCKASELELVEWRPSAAGKVTAGTESRWPGALVRSNHYELEACDKDMISRPIRQPLLFLVNDEAVIRCSSNQKTRVPELSCGFVCVILCSAALVELRLVTDTDRHRHRPVASTAHA